MYISVYHKEYLPEAKIMEYSLKRDNWISAVKPSKKDYEELFNRAFEFIKQDIMMIKKGEKPESIRKNIFV